MSTVAKKKPNKPTKGPDELHQVIVRMPYRIYLELEKDADEAYRSANMHIVWLIQQHLHQKQKDEQ